MTHDQPQFSIESAEARLLEFLHRELVGPDVTLTRDDELLAGEILDSIGVVRFAAFVEDEFQFQILPADLVIENFRSVAVLAAFIRDQGGKAPPPSGR